MTDDCDCMECPCTQAAEVEDDDGFKLCVNCKNGDHFTEPDGGGSAETGGEGGHD